MDRKTQKPKVWIYRDKISGKGKGEATVTYDDPPTATSAIQWFNGKIIIATTLLKPIILFKAKISTERPSLYSSLKEEQDSMAVAEEDLVVEEEGLEAVVEAEDLTVEDHAMVDEVVLEVLVEVVLDVKETGDAQMNHATMTTSHGEPVAIDVRRRNLVAWTTVVTLLVVVEEVVVADSRAETDLPCAVAVAAVAL